MDSTANSAETASAVKAPKPITIYQREEPVPGRMWNPWVEGVCWDCRGGAHLIYRIQWSDGINNGATDVYDMPVEPRAGYPQNYLVLPPWNLYIAPETVTGTIVATIFVYDSKGECVAETSWSYPHYVLPAP